MPRSVKRKRSVFLKHPRNKPCRGVLLFNYRTVRKVAAKAAFFVIYTFKIKKNRKKALRLRKKYYICAFLEETE